MPDEEILDDETEIPEIENVEEIEEVEKSQGWLKRLESSEVWESLPEEIQLTLRADSEAQHVRVQLQALARVLMAVDRAIKALEEIDDKKVKAVVRDLKGLKEKYPAPEKGRHGPPRPYPQPAAKSEPTRKASLLDDAGDLLATKQHEESDQQERLVAERLANLGEKTTEVLDRVNKLTEDLATATGKG